MDWIPRVKITRRTYSPARFNHKINQVVVNSHWDINRKTVLEHCGYQLKQLRVFNAYLLGRKEENLTQYSEKQLNIRAAEQNNHVALLDYQPLFRKRARAPPREGTQTEP